MRQSDTINELAAALAKAQGEFTNPERNREVTVKTKTGGDYKFKYATFDAILDTVRGPLSANGLALVQGVAISERGTMLATKLLHASGQWVESETPVFYSEDRAQAFGSGVSYAKRYAVAALLGITADEDDDGNNAEGNRATFKDRKPAPKPFEQGKPLNEARREMDAGTAQSAPPKPKAQPTAKEWAHSDDAKAWLARAATELAAISDSGGIREWRDANAASINALDDHHVKRHEWLMEKINTRLDEVTNLRPAA